MKEEQDIKPTIAIVAPYFPPEGGGLERYAQEIASGLVKNGNYRVVVITSCHDKGKDSTTEENGVTIFKLAYDFKISNTPFSFKWFIKIRNILKKEKPQVINIHMPVPGIGDIVSLLAGNIPVIVTYHAGSMRKDNSKLNYLVTLYESFVLPIILGKSSKIVCSSDFIRFGFLKKYQDKSITITPAVDSDLFKPDESKKTSYPSILFVAGLSRAEKYKGLQNLIESMVEVRKTVPDLHLIVVGDGNMKDEYIKLVKDKGLDNAVMFTGKLSGQKLAEQYKKAHIFVRPSSNESFGMVILEAMASSLPVIMTEVGGAREIINDRKNGFLIESNKVEYITSKLLELLKNKNLSSRFAILGREKVLREFNWRDKIDNYKNLIEEIINKKSILNNILINSNKIAIIGTSASGKTTLSKRIAKKIKSPVFHIDYLFWNDKWESIPKGEYLVKHKELVSKDKWIIEGYIDENMIERAINADLIFYLDYSRLIISWRFIKRWISNRGRKDLDLPEETIIGFFIKVFIETFIMYERKKIKNLIKYLNKDKVIKITSPKKLENLLTKISI